MADRILTTHVGSLPRTPKLLEFSQKRSLGEKFDQAAFDRELKDAVAGVVRHQKEAGVDLINDGELSKPSYATYIKDRLNGFGGTEVIQVAPAPDIADVSELGVRRDPVKRKVAWISGGMSGSASLIAT